MLLIKQLLQLTQDKVIPESVALELLRTVRDGNLIQETASASNEPLAVVGMAARLPGAETLQEFWQHLVNEQSAVTTIPTMRWPEHTLSGPQRGAFIQGAFDFDPEAFGLKESQASYLDPQQRLMLTVARETLENGLIVPKQRQNPRSIGVFIGGRMKSYGFDHHRQLPEGIGPATQQPLNAAALWGRSQNFIATWIADRFNLNGPALVVDTACSSSLTSVWLACQSIRAGECDMALAGGVDILLDPLTMNALHKAGALSPDGKCWTFDTRANGYVPGEGAAAIMLKRLSHAQRDGDHIWGVIRNTGVNNDGYTMGVTTPNLDAQSALLHRVHHAIGFEGLGLIEAHGTGTTIGDPIEVKALDEVFGQHYAPGSIALSSVKTNIGHLHSAAGIASIVKALLCLYHEAIPASMNSDQINPRLGLDQTPFFVPHSLKKWPRRDVPRRAAISGFGFGGTNGHVVIEEAPPVAGSNVADTALDLLILSDRTGDMLRRRVVDMLAILKESNATLGDICASSRLGFEHSAHRLAFVGENKEEIATKLGQWIRNEPSPSQDRQIMITPSLVLEKYSVHPAYKSAFNEAIAHDQPTDWASVYAMAKLLLSWGVIVQQIQTLPEQQSVLSALANEWPTSRCLAADSDGPAPLLEQIGWLFTAGVDLDWSKMQYDQPWRKVILPPSLSRRRTFHLEEPQRSPRPGLRQIQRPHPLIDTLETSDGTTIFRRHFDADDPYLSQHAVYHQFMLPGVAWLALLDGAFACMGQRGSARIERIRFHQPLIYRQGGATVRGDIQADGQFTIRDEARDALFVTGHIKFGNPPAPVQQMQLDDLLDATDNYISGTTLYRLLRQMGYYHGDYYRNIAWTSNISEKRVLSRIEGTRQAEWNEADVALFPGLLDSITIAALGPNNPALYRDSGAAAFVPISIEQVDHLGPLADAVYVDTVIHTWTDEVCRCTQSVYDRQGNMVLCFHNIASKRVPASGFDNDRTMSDSPHPIGEIRPSYGIIEQSSIINTATESLTATVVERAEVPSNTPTLVHFEEQVLQWLLTTMETQDQADIADTEFLSAGFDSMELVQLSEKIAARVGIDLYPTLFFEYPTPRELVDYFVNEHRADFEQTLNNATAVSVQSTVPPTESTITQPDVAPPRLVTSMPVTSTPTTSAPVIHSEADRDDQIAVIGMGMRLPGADSADEFWQVLTQGQSMITALPENRRSAFSDLSVKGGFLDRVDQFDPMVFGISSREAPYIDPQARIFYEVAWEALENAGYAGDRSKGSNTGIWVGYSHDHYYEERLRAETERDRGLGLQTAIPNRLSFWLDWHGPSIVINTLCSSSIVALHQAAQSLRSRECEMALVGGVHLALSANYYNSMRLMQALSPNGLCRTFDKDADGYVPGEGAGAIVLKRYADAVRDGDNIQAVVLGSAVNHGGRASRLSAPNPQAQMEVVSRAWANAHITPESLGYIEAHGTGTKLGDPIELSALKQAFSKHTARRAFCGIGSVKSLIGHLESAAGVASMIKVILCIQKGYIPPTLHVVEPNPAFNFEESPFYIVDEGTPWQDSVKRAAVSSFGMLGVNAHVILEEAPAIEQTGIEPLRSAEIVKVTALEPESVQTLAQAYEQQVRGIADRGDRRQLADLCHTLNVGRADFRYRVAVVGTDGESIASGLRQVAAGTVQRASSFSGHSAFLFSGQGSQYAGMGRILYETEATFRHTVDTCAALFDPYLDLPLLELLYGSAGEQINQTKYAQPALFAIEYALFELLKSWGIQPDVVCGHSLGEYVAACVAGVFSLEDATRLVALRGTLMQAQRPDGAMAVIRASHTVVEEYLQQWTAYPVEIAAMNSPQSTVISGSVENITKICSLLELTTVPLKVSHAFHSEAMEPAMEPLAEAIANISRGQPTLPVISNVTGQLHSAESICNPETWSQHLRSPVRFADCMETAWASGVRLFWELGPRAVLLTLAQQTIGDDGLWLPTLRGSHVRDDTALLESAAAYYNAGCGALKWQAISSPAGRRMVPAPTYPFKRERFWLDQPERVVTHEPNSTKHPFLGNLSVPTT